MRIEQDPFYYFSDEFYDAAFPVRCHFVRWLMVTKSLAKAMVARADVPFGQKNLSEFVLLPKGGKSFTDVPDQGIFPVFVFAIDDRVKGDKFELADGLKHVQDWASICFSSQFAKNHTLTS